MNRDSSVATKSEMITRKRWARNEQGLQVGSEVECFASFFAEFQRFVAVACFSMDHPLDSSVPFRRMSDVPLSFGRVRNFSAPGKVSELTFA